MSAGPPTVNPYRWAAYRIRERLGWDLHPWSWSSRRKVRSWKDRYRGQAAVILCNGPSLMDVDFSLLNGVFTFGLNKINLLFDRTPFRPSCIVAINDLVVEQNQAFYNETQLPLFLSSRATRWIRFRENVQFLHVTNLHFARDCSMSVSSGHTVTVVALQLAFHMGFERVALVGCDHNFAVKGPANATVRAEGSDRSHFDPNYFANGVLWQLPDLAASEFYYQRAREAFEEEGRLVVNATAGGKLEVFSRMTLEQFLSESRGGA